MTSIRARIRYGTLALLVLTVLLVSYFLPRLHGLGEQVRGALDANYLSIVAGQHMREVLRTLQLAERDGQGRVILPAARANYLHWSEVELHNITEVGEQEVANEIDARGRKLFDEIAADPPGTRHDREFEELFARVGDMMTVNEGGMNSVDMRSQQLARNLAVDVAAGCLAFLLISMVLSIWLGRSMSQPLAELTELLGGVSQRGSQLRIGPQSITELDAVAREFNLMADRLDREGSILRVVFDTMSEGVDVYDNQRKIVYQNPRARDLIAARGVTVDLESFTRDYRFYAESDGEERELDIDSLPIARALTGKVVEHFALRVHTPGLQEHQWLDVSALPLRNREGAIIGGVAIFSDITQRRRIETERAMLASAVEASAGAIIGLTPDFRIFTWNPAAEKLFGYSEAEAIGEPVRLLVPESLSHEHQWISARLRERGSLLNFETTRQRKDGSEFPVLLNIAPIVSEKGQALGYCDLVTDLTDHKRAEELRQARDVAEESARMRSQFLANMSHEIRTPLNPVLGMAQLLLLTQLDTRQREYVETIWSSGDLLRRVVDDILDFSKFAAGKLALDLCDFDVVATIEAAVDAMAERADTKHLELALEIDPAVPRTLRGDSNRLRQVLTNLVSNALKFTENGEVVVTVRALESAAEGAVLEFRINDTGIGISPEVQKQLFRPFIQADASTSRRYGGTGLGLAICRQLVERMNGEIGVESIVGVGSCFHFTARFENSQQHAHWIDPAKMGLANKRVLIVDDNASQRAILRRQLSAWNIQPAYVDSGLDALRVMTDTAAAGHGFHAALIDMTMPGMNGRQLAYEIRSNPRFASTRLALMVAPSTDTSEIKVPEEVDALLVKPFKRSRLIETLCGLTAVDSPDCVSSYGRLVLPRSGEDAPPHAPRPATVLLVEDDKINQMLAQSQLEYLGYKVETVDGGEPALRALDRTAYDIILMDCQMPGMDGYQASALIRKREGQQRHSIIIAMTANAMEGDREKCLAAGMDDYIPKPVDLNLLANKLHQWLLRATDSFPDSSRESPVPAPSGTAHVRIDATVIADLREVSKRCGYDVLRKTAEIFFADAPQRIADLRATISVHDLARAAEIAHQLKGAAGCVGITGVRELCAEIEANSKKGVAHNSEELLRNIETEVSGARAVLLPEEEHTGSEN